MGEFGLGALTGYTRGREHIRQREIEDEERARQHEMQDLQMEQTRRQMDHAETARGREGQEWAQQQEQIRRQAIDEGLVEAAQMAAAGAAPEAIEDRMNKLYRDRRGGSEIRIDEVTQGEGFDDTEIAFREIDPETGEGAEENDVNRITGEQLRILTGMEDPGFDFETVGDHLIRIDPQTGLAEEAWGPGEAGGVGGLWGGDYDIGEHRQWVQEGRRVIGPMFGGRYDEESDQLRFDDDSERTRFAAGMNIATRFAQRWGPDMPPGAVAGEVEELIRENIPSQREARETVMARLRDEGVIDTTRYASLDPEDRELVDDEVNTELRAGAQAATQQALEREDEIRQAIGPPLGGHIERQQRAQREAEEEAARAEGEQPGEREAPVVRVTENDPDIDERQLVQAVERASEEGQVERTQPGVYRDTERGVEYIIRDDGAVYIREITGGR